MKMIKGVRADYSASLFELRGVGIYSKANDEFVDLLKGVYPLNIAQKILKYRLGQKLKKGA